MPAPTYPTTADLVEGTGTRSFAALTTQPGDYIVVGIQVESAPPGDTFTLSGGGGTFAVPSGADSGTPTSSLGRALISVAQDTAGGTRTVQIAPNVGTRNYRARATVVRGSLGPGNAASSSTAQAVSLVRAGANSGIFMGVTDWSTGAVGSPAWTPGGSTQASQQGSAATYIFGRWDDSGAITGAASHGISSPSYTTPAVVVLEMLGTSAPVPDPQWIKQRPGPGLVGPIDPLRWEPWRGVYAEPQQPYPVAYTVASGSGTTSAALTVPPGALVGDMLVVWVAQAGGQAITSVIPSSLVQPPGANVINSGNTAQLTALKCVLTAGDISTGTVQVTWAATQRHVIAAILVRNHANGAVDVVGPTGTGNTVSSVTVPAATPTYPNELVMGAVGGQVNTTSTDITWSGWGPLADYIDAMGTGAVARTFLTVAFNPIGEQRASGPDSPVPTGSTISYGTFRLTIPSVVPAGTGPSNSTQDGPSVDEAVVSGSRTNATTVADSAAFNDRPAAAKSVAASVVDSLAPASALPGRKAETRTTADSASPAATVASRKSPSVATQDSASPAARPVGSKTPSRATVDSLAPVGIPLKVPTKVTQDSVGTSDQPAGAKAASGVVADAVGTAGRPAGTRSANGVAADSAAPADRPAGSKGGTRTAADSPNPADRPAGAKAATRVTVDSAAPADRPTIGSKARSVAVADSTAFTAQATKGLTATHPAASSLAPTETVTGAKAASGATRDSVGVASRPVAGAPTRARAVIDAASPQARPAGRKSPVVLLVESASPTTRLIVTRGAVGSSRASTALASALAGRKLSSAATRSSASLDDVVIHFSVYRNIHIKAGQLRLSGPGGTLRRYASGSIDTSTLAGTVRSRGILGRLRRYGDT